MVKNTMMHNETYHPSETTSQPIELRPCYGPFASSIPVPPTKSDVNADAEVSSSVLREIAHIDDVPYRSLTCKLRDSQYTHMLRSDEVCERPIITHYDQSEEYEFNESSDDESEHFDQYEEYNAHLTRW